jgi:aminoglycoside/choline kinase family phosphotransferase
MKIENEQALGVIDFQDAVIGADTYDLISITRDAYVQWNAERVYDWFKVFMTYCQKLQKKTVILNSSSEMQI